MSESKEIKQFVQAFIKAQSEFKPAIKNKLNPHFKSKFADLETVIDACLVALNKNGISLNQPTRITETNTVVLITRLTHVSGEFIDSELPVINPANTPQGMGSALTYTKRFGIQALLGIPSEDDDGEASHGRKAVSSPTPDNPVSFDDFDFGENIRGPKKQEKIAHKHVFKNSYADPKSEVCFIMMPDGTQCGEKRPKP